MSVLQRIYMSTARARHRRKDGDRGAATVEYALLFAGVAMVVTVAVVLFGGRLLAAFNGFGV